jgi:DNA repair protein RadC
MNMTTRINTDTPIKNAYDSYRIFQRIAKKPREYFAVLTLNGAHAPIKFHIVTIGILTRTLVHPREVFRPALLDNAAAVIVGHNHPSGTHVPSDEDKEITGSLKAAADILGIGFLDHIIVSKKGFCSLKMEGELAD